MAASGESGEESGDEDATEAVHAVTRARLKVRETEVSLSGHGVHGALE